MDKQGLAETRLVRSGSTPLWSQLLADLRERLAAGEFEHSFPGELALVEAYAVSRHTVREALRHLRSEGTVTAARGRKPRLAPVELELPLGALTSLFAEVESRGLEQRSVVRFLEVRQDGVIASRLGLEESTPLFYLERVRQAGAEPLALDRVWLPVSVAAPLLEVDFTHTALYTELLSHCGITLTGGREQVRAVVPSRGERELLRVPPGIALLAVERTGCLHGRPLEIRHTLVRGDRFALTADFHGRSYTLSTSRPGSPPHPEERTMTDPVIAEISPEQASARSSKGEVLLLDVREPAEWEAGHAADALHMPLGSLDVGAIPEDRPVIAMCRSGNRSSQAAAALAEAGRAVSNMTGGLTAWHEAGLPLTTDSGTPGVVG